MQHLKDELLNTALSANSPCEVVKYNGTPKG